MNICTYFDSNYSNKGWACYSTLNKQLGSNLKLYVLCLDDSVYNCAKTKIGIIPISLSEIEYYEPRLIAVKNNRLLKEYYATMTALLPKYIFDKFGEDLVFYTDADIAFWSDPRQMIDILGNKSLMVIDHGIEPPRSNVRFNVGILAYRNDNFCRSFLDWWFNECLKWCKWETLLDGRMADQGYLNRLHTDHEQFNALCLDPIKSGINVGPWIAGNCYIEIGKNGLLKINGKNNLICYHYHEFRLIENGYYPTGWKLGEGFIPFVYEPYYKLLVK